MLCGAFPQLARGDGGTLRLSEQRDGYRISVFTAPSPWRAGPVDVSVLVQAVETGDPIGDVEVTVTATSLERPDWSVRERASVGTATNQLFHAAEFDLPGPGRWRIEVAVAGPQGTATCPFELEAGEPLPSWLRLAPWIGWPAVAVVLFVVHQFLVRRHSRPS